MVGGHARRSMFVHGSNAFPLVRSDVVKFSPQDKRVCEWNGVGYVLVFLSSNNGICTKAPFGEYQNDPDGALIKETSEFIAVSMEDEFIANHVLYGFGVIVQPFR